MEILLVVCVPALAAWGISVDRRCISAFAQRALNAASVVLCVWAVAALAAGGLALTISLAGIATFVVAVELLLAVNVIPSARDFRNLFRHLPLDLRVVTMGGAEMYRTNIARRLDATTLYRLARRSKAEKRSEAVSLRLDQDPDTIFKLYRLRAGVAVLAEGAEEINELQSLLEGRRAMLANQNEILLRRRDMQRLIYRQDRERDLVERIERDLAATASQIRSILDNCVQGADPVARANRAKQLNLVKVLVAYSKRKGMLTLAAADSDTMEGDQLELIGREAMADLRSIGIECAVLVRADSPIAVSAVNVVYDSFYDCIISVLPRVSPVMMVFISQRDGNTLELRVAIECAIGLDSHNAPDLIPKIATSTESWTAVQMGIAHDLEGRLAMRECEHSVGLDDGLVSVTVLARADVAAQEGDAL